MHHRCSKVLTVTLPDGVCQQMSGITEYSWMRERERDGGMEKDIKQASYMICYNVTLGMPIMWKNALIAPSKSRRT